MSQLSLKRNSAIRLSLVTVITATVTSQIQNTAAQVLTKTRTIEAHHPSSKVFKLPVALRKDFKILLIVFK